MVKQLPSEREALTMLRKSGCSPDVIRHSKAVAKLAAEMAERFGRKGVNVDVDLVKIGALLHDLGRSKTHSVHHAVIGAEIATSQGVPFEIISIIERHVGGGITAEEAKILGWPNRSYVPQTIEEKIVSYADKLIEGSRKASIDRAIQDFQSKLGSEHPAIERLKRLHEEMSTLLAGIG